MADLGKRRLPIAQRELLDRLRRAGVRMARSTLNYHLLALERAFYVRRRSYRPKYVAGELRQRVTVYSLGLRAQQWIRLWTTLSRVPADGPPGVRNSGHIETTLYINRSGAGRRTGQKFTGARRKRRDRGPR